MELMNDERIISKKKREILSLRFGLDNQPELTLSAAAARTLAVWRPRRRLIGGVFLTVEERCLGLLEDPLKAYYEDLLIFGYQPSNVTFRSDSSPRSKIISTNEGQCYVEHNRSRSQIILDALYGKSPV
jgi:hypothetical protein